MNKLILLTSLLFFAQSIFANPDWILDPSKVKECQKEFLCAVGSGNTLNWAQRDARTQISKVFSTKIASKFTSTLTSDGQEAVDVVEESTDNVLEGVEILKSFESDSEVYALAALDKNKAAKAIKNDIDKIDSQMEVLLKDQGITSIRKLKSKYSERYLLSKRYEVLKGRGIADVIKYDVIFNKSKKLNDVLIKIKISEKGSVIANTISQLVTDSGMRVVSSAEKAAFTHSIIGTLESHEEYLKINGFVKYKFVFNLSALNSKKVETGSLSFVISTVGRNYDNAYEKALPKIKEFIVEKIYSLNID